MKDERRLKNFALELDLMEKWFDVMSRIEGMIIRCDEKISNIDKRFEKDKKDAE